MNQESVLPTCLVIRLNEAFLSTKYFLCQPECISMVVVIYFLEIVIQIPTGPFSKSTTLPKDCG